jgi:hypothetical protein
VILRSLVTGRLGRLLVPTLVGVCALLPPLAFAQAPADSTAMGEPDPETQYPYTLALWDMVESIPPGQSLRIAHNEPGVVQGFYTGHDDWDLTLEGYGLETTVPLEAIDEIYYERTNHKRALLVGGGLGLLAALGIGALIASAESDDGSSSNTGGIIAISLGLGIPIGVALGGLFGASENSWERVYPAD